MEIVKKEGTKFKINKFLDWLIYMTGYTLVFVFITSFFKTIYIDSNHLILWSIIIELIIYILNKTIKPILFVLTIPITGVTMGLFYPFINLFILYLTEWILGPHFELKSFWIALFASILLSITNFIVERIIRYIIKKVKGQKNG